MANIVAVLPICAVEQHGPHLLVRVFAAINASIIERASELLPANLPCWCWPLCL
ncbi:creatininase family protein [Klebsiella pneumoniae]|uniref:creatininase family protein n=1 Tax=Klebsiella pneumoniae TaxID=573 RepID=UPI002E179BA2|nr:creatininase family protein [Klebsiella pneumoniae]